ncbi:MAG: T9SS type A sorting domain-containing protein [Candidatus Eisenbacteria bacterium]
MSRGSELVLRNIGVGATRIDVIDVSGRRVYSSRVHGEAGASLSLAGLPAGVYSVYVTPEGGAPSTRRLVIR